MEAGDLRPGRAGAWFVVIDEDEAVGGEARVKGEAQQVVEIGPLLAQVEGERGGLAARGIGGVEGPDASSLLGHGHAGGAGDAGEVDRVLEPEPGEDLAGGVGCGGIRRAGDAVRGPGGPGAAEVASVAIRTSRWRHAGMGLGNRMGRAGRLGAVDGAAMAK